MSQVKLFPWIGENYKAGINGRKVLILGESHYFKNPNEAVDQFTNYIIKDLFDENSGHVPYKNTYTKIERAIAGRKLESALQKKELWDSLIFYNYVQFPIFGPRVPPTSSDFLNSQPAFFEVLNKYQPDNVIALGKRLYKNLPKEGVQYKDFRVDDQKFEVLEYSLDNEKKTKLISILHPAAAFSWEYWHKIIVEFLKN